jgi:hypothetical protein
MIPSRQARALVNTITNDPSERDYLIGFAKLETETEFQCPSAWAEIVHKHAKREEKRNPGRKYTTFDILLAAVGVATHYHEFVKK